MCAVTEAHIVSYISRVFRNIEFESRHYIMTYVRVGRIETDIHTKYC